MWSFQQSHLRSYLSLFYTRVHIRTTTQAYASTYTYTLRGCCRPPGQLKHVLEEHARFAPVGNIYNEIVVDTSSVVAQLPASVDGFFYMRGGEKDGARTAHAAFLRAYGLGDGKQTGRAMPLLQLDFANQEAPFSLDPEWAAAR